jgi:hypothetical protein
LCCIPSSSHLSWLDHKLRSFSLCSFIQHPVTSSLFGPNTLLSTLFWKNLSSCSFLNIRDKVSNTYRTTGKIKVFHMLMFTFSENRWENKRFRTER